MGAKIFGGNILGTSANTYYSSCHADCHVMENMVYYLQVIKLQTREMIQF